MASIEEIHKNMGAVVCRRCICRIYGVRLEPKDCIYDEFPQRCTYCKQMHNIVSGFSLSGKLKMMFK